MAKEEQHQRFTAVTMLFEAQHEASLKKWIVKRLEDVYAQPVP